MFVLVSLTAVSAVDTNQTDDLAAEDSDTVTQDILTDESVGAGDFKQLNDNVTSATTTLELTKNYTYNPDVDLDYKDGINITKDITVEGNGYTIDGNGQSRIFNIVNATVTLKNINFINGNASSGGAICFERGNLTIIGCNFLNNNACLIKHISLFSFDSIDISSKCSSIFFISDFSASLYLSSVIYSANSFINLSNFSIACCFLSRIFESSSSSSFDSSPFSFSWFLLLFP